MQNEVIQDNVVPDGDRLVCSPVMTEALCVLDIIRKAGLVMVPPDPTDEMVEAAMAVPGIGADRVRAVFRAMLAAAP
jgi:hypothetical protein